MTATYERHRGFTLTRVLDAPQDSVFRSWTDPAHLHWFFNPAQSTPFEPIEVDLAVGGAWRQRMVIDAATSYMTGGIYREITRPGRLAFYWGAVGGWPEIDRARLDDAPLATVVLGARGAQTDMVFTLALPDSWPADRVRLWETDGPHDGWSQTLDRLVDAVRQPEHNQRAAL
ncbi:MAG: SRPBCC domain-containing protein [Mycetocola sp.]